MFISCIRASLKEMFGGLFWDEGDLGGDIGFMMGLLLGVAFVLCVDEIINFFLVKFCRNWVSGEFV